MTYTLHNGLQKKNAIDSVDELLNEDGDTWQTLREIHYLQLSQFFDGTIHHRSCIRKVYKHNVIFSHYIFFNRSSTFANPKRRGFWTVWKRSHQDEIMITLLLLFICCYSLNLVTITIKFFRFSLVTEFLYDGCLLEVIIDPVAKTEPAGDPEPAQEDYIPDEAELVEWDMGKS